MNILVLDDEKEIADLVEVYLQNENYHIYKFYKSEEAINCIDTKKIDVAILDVMIEGKDGFEICRYIREKGFKFPVIIAKPVAMSHEKLLSITGMFSADDAALSIGCDISDVSFWMEGIELIEKYVERIEDFARKM